MGKGQCGQTLIVLRKHRQFRDHIHEFLFDQFQRLRHHYDIRVISYITRCGTQMNDPCRLRTLLSIGIDMAHHVMTHFLFPGLGHIIVDILRMALQFVNLFLGDNRLAVLAQSQLHLRLRQGDPQPPPGSEFHVR